MRPKAALSARDDFEDFEFFAVGDGVGDRDRGLAAHDNDAVGADAFGAQHLFDGGGRACKLDLLRALVEPAADGDFGRNPSFALRWQTLKTETSL